MTTLQLLETAFPKAALFERFLPYLYVSILVTLVVGTIWCIIKRVRGTSTFPLCAQAILLGCVAGIQFAFIQCAASTISPATTLTSLTEMAKVLDSNFSITAHNYYNGEFNVFLITMPASEKTIEVLNKQVSAPIPSASFTMGPKELKHFEQVAKEQKHGLVSKLVAAK